VARPRLTVLGTGYLGATHAACMAHLGFEVMGMDVDAGKIAALSAGHLPIFEPELPELLREALDSGRLHFTTSYDEVAEFGDVHFLCVGTPQRPDSSAADLRYVDAVVDALAPRLSRPTLVVGKSTVPVGTAERIATRVAELSPAGDAVEVAWNPEFLREGHAVADTLHPDRLVIGVRSVAAEQTLRDVYAPLIDNGVPLVVTDFATAELVKTAANAFLATKISFINAMAELCEAAGGDVIDLADALAFDPRIGGRFLQAGLGFGGGCLPKDIRAFIARAEELGVEQAVSFLRDVQDINLRRRTRMVELTKEALGGTLAERTVAVWGAAFKPDSDDVRDSPALFVAQMLADEGARVRVYDPQAMANSARLFPALDYADSAVAAALNADVVLHLTEWQEFAAVDPAALGEVVAQRIMVDGRNSLDVQRWRDAGWTYRALGRP
jgi:UDPglucose 6-dehydrogenase